MTDFQRILIAGGPRTGKTVLSIELGRQLGVTPRSTDELKDVLAWPEISAAVADWFEAPGPWVIEGVQVPRGIRKWLDRHPGGLPCDLVYWSETPKVEQTPGQRSMAKGVKTVWSEVVDALFARGATIRGF